MADRKLAFGVGTLHWAGLSALSNTLTVTHGLGATPIVVVGNVNNAAYDRIISFGNLGATTFDANGFDAGGIPGASDATFYWIAIG